MKKISQTNRYDFNVIERKTYGISKVIFGNYL